MKIDQTATVKNRYTKVSTNADDDHQSDRNQESRGKYNSNFSNSFKELHQKSGVKGEKRAPSFLAG